MSEVPDERPMVLVVENEALLAMAVEDALSDAGYRVSWESDGLGALAAFQTGPLPSAAVVDLNLGHGIEGREVIRRLRDSCPDLPVIVVTGYASQGPEADLRGLGGPTARLTKPFDFDELLDVLVWALKPTDGMSIPCRRGFRASGAPMSALHNACIPVTGRSTASSRSVVELVDNA